MCWVPIPWCVVFLIVLLSELSLILSGLPAFKPGEKVEIDFGMDDI